MSSFGSAGRFGGRVVGKAVGVRRKLSVADEKKVRSKLKAAAYTQGGWIGTNFLTITTETIRVKLAWWNLKDS